MTATIRPMRDVDLDEVLVIAGAAPQAPRWGPRGYQSYFDSDGMPPLLRVAVVAEADGHVAGFAAATLLLDGVENRCELDTIAVDPALRRRGIGAELLLSVLAWAAKRGARQIGLEVRISNARALAFYQRMGFTAEGRRTLYYADPQEDALLLSRLVTAVTSTNPISTENHVEGDASRC
jgi:[ribosomal protein S18]-alanine N-acetyltransferase